MSGTRCKKRKRLSDKPTLVGTSALIVVTLIALLGVLQGGFGNLVTCLCGVIVCIVGGIGALRSKRRNDRILLLPLLFFALACCYMASAIANGLTLTTLSETGVWFGVAGMALLAGGQTLDQRTRTISLIAWAGLASSVLGTFVFLGILPFPGGMNDGRLQFFFQYANTAGIWFAAASALCFLSSSERLRSFASLPLAALLLTQSGGAILVFLIGFAVAAVCWCRANRYTRLTLSVCQALLALIIFAGLNLEHGLLGLALVAAAIGFSFAIPQLEKLLTGIRRQRPAAASVLAIAVIAAVATLALFPDRVHAAAASLIERLYHIADGIAMYASSPLLGVGPDNWQYLYPYIQTAQYHTTVVHSSYVQVALDSGAVGFVLLACAIAIGVKHLLRPGRTNSDVAASAAALLVAAHALIDFDLQFGAIAFFLAFLLSAPQGPSVPSKSLWLGLACLVLGAPACSAGALAEASKIGLSLANATGDYREAQGMFEQNPFAQSDVAAQTEYLAASYSLGDSSQIEAFLERFGVSSDRQAMYVAASLYESGETQRAGEVLIEQLEVQPYNDEFFRSVKTMIEIYGLDDALKDRYNAAVANASGLAASSSNWLPEQEVLDTYAYERR